MISEDTKVPRQHGWRKEDIVAWLLTNGVDSPEADLRKKTIVELVSMSNKVFSNICYLIYAI